MSNVVLAIVGGIFFGALIVCAMMAPAWLQRYPEWRSLLRKYQLEGCTVNYLKDWVQLEGVIKQLELNDGRLLLVITDVRPYDSDTPRILWADDLRLEGPAETFHPTVSEGRLQIETPSVDGVLFVRLPTKAS